MARLTIQRTNIAMPSQEELAGARALLFGALDGQSEEDRKGWRKFWKRMTAMQPGDLIAVDMTFPRNVRFHRKFFALLQVGFDAWEPGFQATHKGEPIGKNFEHFRKDVTILAGFYEPAFALDGSLQLEAKSIAFANMDDVEFERVYSAVADVLLAKVLRTYSRDDLDQAVERILGFL